MADDTSKPAIKPTDKEVAVKAYYDADTKAKKAEAVKKYPILKTIFSEGNYS